MSTSNPFAGTTCSLEIYPYEGGPLSIQGGLVRSVTVRKSLRGGAAGSMQIQLAPGGPMGPEDPATWSKRITPMSHVLVGMSRGTQSAVVMDGIIPAIGESQVWSSGSNHAGAQRGQAFSGVDFTYFFQTFNWFALTFVGLMAGTPVGNALDFIPSGLQALLSQGLAGGGSPVQMGRLWYQKVMAGQNGIMAKTSLPYLLGSRVSFTSALSALWENYPEAYIPVADYFMTHEGAWLDKFQTIFPEPWYEFFITTAPKDAYLPLSGFSGYNDPGTQFSMPTVPGSLAAGPQLVARVNPVPRLTAVQSGPNQIAIGNLDVSRWINLPIYDFTQEPFGFIASSVSFSADTVANFYQLNPTAFKMLLGTNNGNNMPFPFSFIAAADAASVQRYGFRPQIGTTRWFYDPDGKAAQGMQPITQSILGVTAAMISWYHPQPLMAQGQVTIPLTPTIQVGTRFRYAPYKDNVPWDFYVEGFEHRFVFGGQSSTTLTLSRGLPTSVYNDIRTNGVLQAVHIGNAMRQNGEYVVGLPANSGPPLQFVATPEQAAAMNQQISNIPNTPQTP